MGCAGKQRRADFADVNLTHGSACARVQIKALDALESIQLGRACITDYLGKEEDISGCIAYRGGALLHSPSISYFRSSVVSVPVRHEVSYLPGIDCCHSDESVIGYRWRDAKGVPRYLGELVCAGLQLSCEIFVCDFSSRRLLATHVHPL
jgi:hypothetical protein